MARYSLQAFLRSQQAGELDSEGEFTLNSAQAIAKMGQYQLASPGLWLVKLVQAGVAMHATEIEITTQENRALLKFFGGLAVEGSELGRSIMSGELPSESWKLHIVVGLRALMACRPPQLCVIDSKGRATHVGLAEGVAPPVSISRGLGAGFAIYVELPAARGWRRWLSRDPFFLHQLRSRCQLCHLRLRVNGDTFSGRFPPEVGTWTSHLSRPRAAIALQPSGSQALPLVISDLGGLDPKLCTLPKLRLEPYRLGGLAILREGLVGRSRSWCYWVKDGVLLRPRQLDFAAQTRTLSHFFLDLYLDGSQVEVDLSGFHTQPTAVDFLNIVTQLRQAFQAMDFSLLERRQPGWSSQAQAKENRRALLDALTWLKFSA